MGNCFGVYQPDGVEVSSTPAESRSQESPFLSPESQLIQSLPQQQITAPSIAPSSRDQEVQALQAQVKALQALLDGQAASALLQKEGQSPQVTGLADFPTAKTERGAGQLLMSHPVQLLEYMSSDSESAGNGLAVMPGLLGTPKAFLG